MPPEADGDLLPYYIAELAYLRSAGGEFARRYPRVAGALDLSPQISTDPQIQRLIESVAFLTGRLQRLYDQQFPQIPEALLGLLYPQMAAPIPSMAIAAFLPDPEQSRALAGVTVPAGTRLFATAQSPPGSASMAEAPVCRFRTGYPVTLWPIDVADARLEPRALYPVFDARPDIHSVLRIRLRCLGHRRFAEFAPRALRLFLSSRTGGSEAMHEVLNAHLRGIAIAPLPPDTPPPDGPAPGAAMSEARLAPVGLEIDDALLPCPAMSHQAYRLLQEYFAFPEKFMFADVLDLPLGALGAGTQADLLLLLGAPPHQPVQVDATSFVLGCTPMINLFSRFSEPIRLDHTKLEYRLVADSRFESSTEIHSIERVTRSVARADASQTIPPLFSWRHAETAGTHAAMYHARRQDVTHAAFGGSEMLVSFVDAALDPVLPAADTVYAQVTCTNRGLAEQISADTALDLEVDLPVRGVRCLTRPTRQRAPPSSGGALWRLVSQLSTNHLAIGGGPDGAAALREILLLHCPATDPVPARRLQGLVAVSSRRIARRLGPDAWRGFCGGLEIGLTFDEQAFAGSSAHLFGAVLSRFLGLHAAANSFTELVMQGRQREEVWRWPARTGETTLA